MAFGSKLMLRYSLDMWDESTLGSFVKYGSIIRLFATVIRHCLLVFRTGKLEDRQ